MASTGMYRSQGAAPLLPGVENFKYHGRMFHRIVPLISDGVHLHSAKGRLSDSGDACPIASPRPFLSWIRAGGRLEQPLEQPVPLPWTLLPSGPAPARPACCAGQRGSVAGSACWSMSCASRTTSSATWPKGVKALWDGPLGGGAAGRLCQRPPQVRDCSRGGNIRRPASPAAPQQALPVLAPTPGAGAAQRRPRSLLAPAGAVSWRLESEERLQYPQALTFRVDRLHWPHLQAAPPTPMGRRRQRQALCIGAGRRAAAAPADVTGGSNGLHLAAGEKAA